MSVSIEKCMSIKNKTECSIQCPHPRKIGEYCGVHNRAKTVIRIDKQPSESRILINLTFKKPPKSEYYDNLDDLMNVSDLDYTKLIKTLKYFQIQLQGTKQKLAESLIKYIKDQELIKGGYDNLDLCNNTTDFYDFVELKNVPKDYIFVFTCLDGRLYGMDLRSMHTYFQELEKEAKFSDRPVEYINPYNRQKLTSQSICSYRNRIKELEKHNKPVKYPDEEHDPEDQLTFKVLEVFNIIYNYGYIIDASWFLKMTKVDLLDYYLVMEDIWNHRLRLTISTKRSIVPHNINIFNKTEYYDLRECDKLQLQDVLISKIEEMISTGVDRESRVLGIHYCLIGLCEVCEIDTYLPFGEE